jgi:hypothetical protein
MAIAQVLMDRTGGQFWISLYNDEPKKTGAGKVSMRRAISVEYLEAGMFVDEDRLG